MKKTQKLKDKGALIEVVRRDTHPDENLNEETAKRYLLTSLNVVLLALDKFAVYWGQTAEAAQNGRVRI